MKQTPANNPTTPWLDLLGAAADDPGLLGAAVVRLAHLAVAEHRLQVAAGGGLVRPLDRAATQVMPAGIAGEGGR